MAKGLCRIKDGWDNEHHEDSVWVEYEDGQRQEISAKRYVKQGYKPPLDGLPPCPPTGKPDA